MDSPAGTDEDAAAVSSPSWLLLLPMEFARFFAGREEESVVSSKLFMLPTEVLRFLAGSTDRADIINDAMSTAAVVMY